MSAAALLLLRRASWWQAMLLDDAMGCYMRPGELHLAECRVREQAAYVIGWMA